MKLYAPGLYWALSPEGKADICNGCGTKGFTFMYTVGVDEEDRAEADRVFKNNLFRIIEAKTKWAIIKILRRRRAVTYYQAVRMFGGPPFWNGKNEPGTEQTV